METETVHHNIYIPDMTYLESSRLIKQPIHTQRWETMHLDNEKGQTKFSIGKISKDICFTQSSCFFYQDYHACIDYTEQTVLLVFGIKGCSSFFLSNNQSSCTVRPGDVWLINIAEEKLFRTTPAVQENNMVVLKYSSQRLNSNLCKNDQKLGDILSSAKISRLGHQVAVETCVDDLVNNPLDTASNQLVAESHALALLARWVAPNPHDTVAQPDLHRQQKLTSTEISSLEKTVNTLISDLARTPSLDQLANQVNMSHSRLNRCFKKAYGTTVYSWLRNYRLERARYYLYSLESSVTEIAFQCGFSSTSHFSQAFKQQYGCSPLEYRDQSIACS